MKQKIQFIISASAASVLAFSALAVEDSPDSKAEQPDYTRERIPNAQRADRLRGAAKASDLIGMTVKNYQDEKLGKVEDLAVDVESGRIVQVILSTGGLLGVGDRLTAVPPGALHHDLAEKVIHLNADKEKLKGSPEFEMSKWAECCDSDHLSKVYRHYGQEPAFRFIHKADAISDRQRNKDGSPISDAQRNKEGERTNDRLARTDDQRNTADSPNTRSTRNADGTWSKDRISYESQSMIPASRLGQLQKASTLIGTSVKNLQDEKLGKVENLLVDLTSGRIVALILSSGGFLGLGDELSAIPPTALRFTTDRDTLQLDASKEMLSSAPHFKANQWPDFNQPTYSDGVYRAYNVEPYFTTNVNTEVDNTARNVRDRDERTLTPLDQGNNKADLATTAQIRKDVIAGKMSLNARNVKIITKNGQVTLRGPVSTAEEKRLIGEIANRIAQSGNVDNQLEVKLDTTGSDK